MQVTLTKPIHIEGIGLHSGKTVTMVLRPADVNTGIVFVRTDVQDKNNVIPAKWNAVVDTRLCTVIANEDGVSVGTIEHLMSAFWGCGIDNVIVELDAPEVPVMDGSSVHFVECIDEVGVKPQNAPRKMIKVLKEVSIEKDGCRVTLSPGVTSVFSGTIDFDHPQIGEQNYEVQLVNGNFRHQIAECRTFGFLKDVEAMQSNGLALGGSLDNAIVLDDTSVINQDGLRHSDEFIRHKLLDAIGDLYLAGGPVIGTYHGERASHALNNLILRELFTTPGAWTIIECDMDTTVRGTHCPVNLPENQTINFHS